MFHGRHNSHIYLEVQTSQKLLLCSNHIGYIDTYKQLSKPAFGDTKIYFFSFIEI